MTTSEVLRNLNQVFHQFWKDFRSIALHPVFFLVAGAVTSIWSVVFPRLVFTFARRFGVSPFSHGGMERGMSLHETVFQNHLSITHILLLFMVPVLTMRLIAEEKRSGSFDLLLTSPVSATQIVLGKFFAAYSATLLLLFLSVLYPFLTLAFAQFNVFLLLSAYLSIALLLAVFVAMGLFASSLTSSSVLSAFIGVALSLSLHFMDVGVQDSAYPFWNDVISYLSVNRHMGNFFNGHVITSSLAFFVILTGFFVFLTQRSIEATRGELG